MPSGTQMSLRDLAAERAIIERKAEHLRVDERVILADRRDLLVVLDIVDVVAEPLVHLGSIDVEAEEIRCRIDISRLQRARAAIDERDLRLGLRVIMQGNSFRAGKRGDQKVDFVLLDQLLGGA